MPNINTVLVAGHVGKDPVVRQAGNSQVANFSLATTRKWKAADGTQKESTTWHNVVCWGWLSEVVAEQFRKGDGVIVYGRVETRSWEAPEGRKYITEVIAEDAYKVVAHPRKQGSSYAAPNRGTSDYQPPAEEEAPF